MLRPRTPAEVGDDGRFYAISVADGTELAAQKLARVLTNDPGMGVIRHVDAGYEQAERVAVERGVRVPMKEGN